MDHLVVFEEQRFAVMVESKYRLGEDVEETHVPRAIQYAQAVSEVTDMFTWPVVCQALAVLRDDVDYEWIGRRWSQQGSALLCDAQWLARSIQDIVNDLDTFRVQEWTFPET